MNRYSFSPVALVLAALLFLGPSKTLAEPVRNADIWDWQDHEPALSDVQKKEHAAGILPPPRQQQADDRELQRICRNLLNAPRPTLSRSTNGTDQSGAVVMIGRNHQPPGRGR
jgi:hypothetical protein